MTSSIVYNSVSSDLKPGNKNTPDAVFVRYPNKTDFPVDTVVRYTPRVSPVKISFAPDTNFDYRNRSKVAEKVKRSNYNFRPVSEKRRNSLKFQAPASTLPSSTFVTTNKQDYGDTTEHLKRSLRPTPKWFYKSQTSLHEIRPNLSEGYDQESKDTNSLSDCGSKTYARSLVLFPSQTRAKALDTLVTNPSSYEYKPLVGERIILKAQLLREVPNNTAEKDSYTDGVTKVDNRRTTRFSDSLNRYSACNSDSEYQKKTSKVFSKTSNRPNNRQKTTAIQKVTTDMERTYNKQAALRNMIKK